MAKKRNPDIEPLEREQHRLLGGRTVRDYRLIEIVGRGGMGVVWLARRATDEHEVVIKCIQDVHAARPRAEQLLPRLVREARILSQLEHENIVRAIEWFTADGELYLVLERVVGVTMASWLRGEDVTLADRLRVLRQVVDAVSYAHGAGVIHRDLKPDNVMVAAGPTAKVLDFGLARALDSTQLTRTGLILGTLAFMAPEQARGEKVDERADVFALGMMLARCLGAERPFQSESTSVRYAELMSSAPIELDAWLPADVRSILERAVAKEPGDRLGSADELGPLLDGLLQDPTALAERLDRARREPVAPAAQRLARIERPEVANAVSGALTRHASRRGSVVAVLGPPGSGRTTALREVGDRLRAGGVATESARFVVGAVPHIVVLDLIRQREGTVLQDVNPCDAVTHDGRGSALATAAEPLDQVLERYLAETEERARASSLALLLDDVQNASPDELAWVGRLAAQTSESPLVLVLAGDVAREGAPAASAGAYDAFLSRLAAASEVRRVLLAPLPHALVTERLAASGVPEDSAQDLAARSGRCPTVLNLLLERWHAGLSIDEEPASGPPEYLGRLKERFLRLDAASAELVRALVRSGGEVQLAALAEAAGVPRLAATSRLRELESKHGWLRLDDGVVQLTQPYLAAIDLELEPDQG